MTRRQPKKKQPEGRPATGSIEIRPFKSGTDASFWLHVTVDGERRSLRLGRASEGWTPVLAKAERRRVVDEIAAGVYREPVEELPLEERDPTFHVWASRWLELRSGEIQKKTYEQYEYLLRRQLLASFHARRLTEITYRVVDEFKRRKIDEMRRIQAAKEAGVTLRHADGRPMQLGPKTINHAIDLLSTILAPASPSTSRPSSSTTRSRRSRCSRAASTAADRTFSTTPTRAVPPRSSSSRARVIIAILVESDLGPWITVRKDAPVLDLADVIATGGVAYIRLDSDRRLLAAQMLGAALVGDLIALTAERQHSPIPTFVVLDEFGALDAAQVSRLFQRGRSAGLSLLLGAQEITSLAATREELLNDVLCNATTVIAHRQGVPESAELIADLAGTEGTWVTTRRTDHIGDTEHGTRSRAYQYVLHPDRLKRLTTGQAAVIVPGQHTATIAQIFHDPTLAQEPHYDPEQFDVEAGWTGTVNEGSSDAGAE